MPSTTEVDTKSLVRLLDAAVEARKGLDRIACPSECLLMSSAEVMTLSDALYSALRDFGRG